MGRTNIVERSPAIQELVHKFRDEGKGYVSIANELNKRGYSKVKFMAVKRYLDKVKDSKGRVISQDERLAGYVKERIFDTGEMLRRANQQIWQMLDNIRINKTFRLKLLKELRQTIKLADDLMNQFKGLEIKQGPGSKIEIVQVVINQLQEMEKRGDIKIINPKLKEGGVIDGNNTENKDNR